jgi:hypothetical protein
MLVRVSGYEHASTGDPTLPLYHVDSSETYLRYFRRSLSSYESQVIVMLGLCHGGHENHNISLGS